MSDTPPNWTVQIAGVTYGAWFTDVAPEGAEDKTGVFFDVRTAEDEPLMYIFRDGATGAVSVTALAADLPVDLVGWSLMQIKSRWLDG